MIPWAYRALMISRVHYQKVHDVTMIIAVVNIFTKKTVNIINVAIGIKSVDTKLSD